MSIHWTIWLYNIKMLWTLKFKSSCASSKYPRFMDATRCQDWCFVSKISEYNSYWSYCSTVKRDKLKCLVQSVTYFIVCVQAPLVSLYKWSVVQIHQETCQLSALHCSLLPVHTCVNTVCCFSLQKKTHNVLCCRHHGSWYLTQESRTLIAMILTQNPRIFMAAYGKI